MIWRVIQLVLIEKPKKKIITRVKIMSVTRGVPVLVPLLFITIIL